MGGRGDGLKGRQGHDPRLCEGGLDFGAEPGVEPMFLGRLGDGSGDEDEDVLLISWLTKVGHESQRDAFEGAMAPSWVVC